MSTPPSPTSELPTFGDVRALLHSPPTSSSWERLCRMSERWPDFEQFEREVLPYALAKLERWPAALRAAPPQWTEQFLAGDAPLGLALVRALHVHDPLTPAMWLRLLQHPRLSQLRQLTLSGTPIDAERAEALGTSALIEGLEVLKLLGTQLDDEALTRLLGHLPADAQLTHLWLNDNRLYAEGIEALVRCDALQGLRELHLASNHFQGAGADALARPGALPQLRELNLAGDHIGPRGAEALAEADFVPQLERLDLHANSLGDAGLEALTERADLRALRHLSQGINRASTATLVRWAERVRLTPGRLESLDLSWTPELGAQGLLAVLDAPWSSGLVALNLLGCDLGDEGARLLGRARISAGLRFLDLGQNELSARGAEALARTPHIGQLRALNLANNPLGPRGLRALLRAPWLERLERLDLSHTDLDARAIEELAQTPALGGLRALSLEGNTLGARGAQALYRSPHLSEPIRRRWALYAD